MKSRPSWVLLAVACLTSPVPAQDDPSIPVAEEPGGGDLRRSDYSGLWPFYSRESYEDGSTRTSSLFGAIRSEELANGDRHHRVLPFYSRSIEDGGEDRRLAIYPLLYLRRRSPIASHDIALPFFAWWRNETENETLLWPLLHIARRAQDEPFRFIPTLFSSGGWEGGSQQRLGLPYILDLFERSADAQRSAWTAGALLPWGPPTRFGWALAKSYEDRVDGDWHLHVAPLFLAGEGKHVVAAAGSSEERTYYLQTPLYGSWRTAERHEGTSIPALLTWWEAGPQHDEVNVLWPLLSSVESSTREHLRILPFYAGDEEKDGSRSDLYLPFALSRFRSGTRESATDLLWPLFHVSESTDGVEKAIRVLPFYDHSVDADAEWRGIGGVLYRRHEYPAEERIARWYLFPLGLHERSPQESSDWALPFWLDLESRLETERGRTTMLAPFYLRHEVEEKTGESWHTRRRWLHVWPFYGRHLYRRPDSDIEVDTRYTLAPLLSIERTRNVASGEVEKSRIDAPWPLLSHQWTAQSWDFSLVEILLRSGDSPVRSYFSLWRTISIESGSEAEAGGDLGTLSLVEWFDDGDETSLRVFPGLFEWLENEEETRVTGPLWLTRYRNSKTDGWFHLFPVGFGEWDETRSEFGIFPLHYRSDSGSAEIERWSLGRFFFFWNAHENEHESHDSLLWKAVEYDRSDDGDYDFRILHRLFVNREVDGQRELVVNPFFSRRSDARSGDSSFRLLGWVYSSVVEDGVQTRRIFGIPISQSDAPAG